MKVGEKMTRDVVTMNITATAAEAANKMASEKVGTILILDDGSLKGLLLTDI